jgi:hypothetical protein
MRSARAQLASVGLLATSPSEEPCVAPLGDLSLALVIDGPVRHPRAGLRNAFPARAVRVLRPKVP